MKKRLEIPFTGLLAKGHKVKRFQFLKMSLNGELVPTDNETESYAVSLDDVDSMEGRREIRAILHGKGLASP